MNVLHFNSAPTRWGHSPLCPPGAMIPLCECDGDQPQDGYTLDPTAVTCPDCRREIYAAWERADGRGHAERDRMLAALVDRRMGVA